MKRILLAFCIMLSSVLSAQLECSTLSGINVVTSPAPISGCTSGGNITSSFVINIAEDNNPAVPVSSQWFIGSTGNFNAIGTSNTTPSSIGTAGNITSTVNFNLSNVTTSPPVTGYYAVITIDGNECKSATVSANVVNLPSAPNAATKSPDVSTVCVGTALSLTSQATGGNPGLGCSIEYRFSTNSGATYTNAAFPVSFTAASATPHLIQARRTNCQAGCTESGWQTVASWTVVAAPAAPTTATRSPNFANVCTGTTLTLSGAASGGNAGVGCAIEYQFSTNGGSTWQPATPTTTIPSFAATGTNNRIRARRANCQTGCATSVWNTVATWNVVPQPQAPTNNATKSPNVAAVCQNTSLTLLNAPTGGSAGVSCEFQYRSSTNNGSTWSAPSTAFPIITSVGTQTHLIQARRSNCQSGCTQSDWATVASWDVSLQPSSPTTAVKSPNLATVCQGTTLSLASAATGGNPGVGCNIQYRFSTDNGGSWSDTFNGITFSFEAVGTQNHIIQARRGNCAANTGCNQSVWTEVASWAVQAPPTAPTSISGSAAICNGSNLVLEAHGGNNGSGAVFQWGTGTPPSNVLSGNPTGASVTVTPTADTQYWVRRRGNTACTNFTSAVTFSAVVLPEPNISINIPNSGQLCQLLNQSVQIQNTTSYISGSTSPGIIVSWSSGTSSGTTTINPGAQGDASIDLSAVVTATQNFQVNNVLFSGFPTPNCATNLPLSVAINVKPRPQVVISGVDQDNTGNALCTGYGPVISNVATIPPANVSWVASYSINGSPQPGVINSSPFTLDNSTPGVHTFQVNQVSHTQGLACGHNPNDYNDPNATSSVTIKQTPAAPSFLPEAPNPLEFCDFTAPIVSDSIARVNDLNEWIDNENNLTVRWKNANNNSLANLNPNLPLVNNNDYYPVFEVNGCQSKFNGLDDANIIVSLLPLPNLTQSTLNFPTEECSGRLVNFNFSPATSINNFSIWDIQNIAGQLQSSIQNTSGISVLNGIDFTLTNATDGPLVWEADVYAQNSNGSDVNPVTCWAPPIPVAITVNPNATFDQENTTIELCENGSGFSIDPLWNGIGEGANGGVFWNTSNLPFNVSIDEATQVLTANISGDVTPGTYTATISGTYPNSDCDDEIVFQFLIYPKPQFEIVVLDVDGTFCHNEYTSIELAETNDDFSYSWSCLGCDADTFDESTFIARWINPEPISGTWEAAQAEYSVVVTDTSTDLGCTDEETVNITIDASYASCPEGIAWFAPGGLSLVDEPALYFQWYRVDGPGQFSLINGATNQTYFPIEGIDECDPERYIVASSLYPDKCWSTTLNCFENFGLRECDGPKTLVSTKDFALYPNPVSQNIVILEELKRADDARYQIDVMDLAGKIVHSERIIITAGSKNRIELPEVAYGVYLFKVSNTKYQETFKLVINK